MCVTILSAGRSIPSGLTDGAAAVPSMVRNGPRRAAVATPRQEVRAQSGGEEIIMSRRRKVYKKEEKVDSRYGSPAVARLISTVMKRGKKSLAERIVYTAIDKSREGSDSVDPLEVLNKALENVRPRLEVKSRRVGGATYQVPMEVAPARQVSLAMRWIVQYADNRRGMPMADSLAQEIKDAAAGQGNAIKKREDTHKMAQANRAFAHFRW